MNGYFKDWKKLQAWRDYETNKKHVSFKMCSDICVVLLNAKIVK